MGPAGASLDDEENGAAAASPLGPTAPGANVPPLLRELAWAVTATRQQQRQQQKPPTRGLGLAGYEALLGPTLEAKQRQQQWHQGPPPSRQVHRLAGRAGRRRPRPSSSSPSVEEEQEAADSATVIERRLTACSWRLRQARWFEAADALDLLASCICPDDDDGAASSSSSSRSSQDTFPSQAVLALLLTLARLPEVGAQTREKPPRLGPLATALLVAAKGNRAVLRPAHQPKQGGLPWVPEALVKTAAAAAAAAGAAASSSSSSSSLLGSGGRDFLVYGEEQVLDPTADGDDDGRVFGSVLYPRWVFEAPLASSSAASAAASGDGYFAPPALFPPPGEEVEDGWAAAVVHSRASPFTFMGEPQADPSAFSALRARGLLAAAADMAMDGEDGDATSVRFPRLSTTLALPAGRPLEEGEAVDPADVAIRAWERASRHRDRQRSRRRQLRDVSSSSGGGDIGGFFGQTTTVMSESSSSTSLGPSPAAAAALHRLRTRKSLPASSALSPIPPPQLRQPAPPDADPAASDPAPATTEWRAVGWESSWAPFERQGCRPRGLIPMPPPLVSQDGVGAFEAAAWGFLNSSRRGEGDGRADVRLRPERALVDHAFHALNGLFSVSFLLDDRRVRLVPAPGQRAQGKSARGVAQALAAFGEAGTCFLRLEALARHAREQASSSSSSSCSGSTRSGRDSGGRGKVVQAFFHALGDQLAACQALTERHRAAASGRDGGPSLMAALAATRRLRARLGFLAELCGCRPPPPQDEEEDEEDEGPWSASACFASLPAGAALLSSLYHAARRAEATATLLHPGASHDEQQQKQKQEEGESETPERALVLSLLEAAAGPFLGFLAQWTYQGLVTESEDPHKEFPIRALDAIAAAAAAARQQQQEEDDHGEEGDPSGGRFLSRAFDESAGDAAACLPAFLDRGLARRVVVAGKLLVLLSRASRPYYRSCAAVGDVVPPRLALVGVDDEEEEEEKEKGEDVALSRLVAAGQRRDAAAAAEVRAAARRRVEAERQAVAAIDGALAARAKKAQAKEADYRAALRAQAEEEGGRRRKVLQAGKSQEDEEKEESATAAATTPSASGRRILAPPGGASDGMAAVLREQHPPQPQPEPVLAVQPPKPPTAASGNGGGDDDEKENALPGLGMWAQPPGMGGGTERSMMASWFQPEAPAPQPQQQQEVTAASASPSFSGKRIVAAPGGASEGMAAALSHNEAADAAAAAGAEETDAGTATSSFSGIRVTQAPGGSSQGLAARLFGTAGGSSGPGHGRSNSSKAGDVAEAVVASEPQDEQGGGSSGGSGREEEDKDEDWWRLSDPRPALAGLLPSAAAPTASAASSFPSEPKPQSASSSSSAPLVLRTGPLAAQLRRQCDLVERAAVAFFVHEAHLGRHVQAIRRYLLGSGSPLMQEFVAMLQTRVTEDLSSNPLARVDWRRPSNLLRCHGEAVASVGLEADPCLPCFTYVVQREQQQPSQSSQQQAQAATSRPTRASFSQQQHFLDAIEPRYQPPWPLGVVLPPSALAAYGAIHRRLLRLHWLALQTRRCQEGVRAASKNPAGELSPRAQSILRGAHALLHRLAGLASVLLEHMAAQIEGDAWRRLDGLLARARRETLTTTSSSERQQQEDHEEEEEDEDEVGSAPLTVARLTEEHAAYARDVAARCFVPWGESASITAAGTSSLGSDAQLHGEIHELVALLGDACRGIEAGVLDLLVRGSGSDGGFAAETELAIKLATVRTRLNARLATFIKALGARRLAEATAAGAAAGMTAEARAAAVARRGSDYSEYLLSRLEDVMDAERRCAEALVEMKRREEEEAAAVAAGAARGGLLRGVPAALVVPRAPLRR